MLNILTRALVLGFITGGVTFGGVMSAPKPKTLEDLHRAAKVATWVGVGTAAVAVAAPVAIGYRRHRRDQAQTQHLIQNPPKPLIESYPQGDYCLLPPLNPYHISIDDDGDEVLRAYVEWLKQSRTRGDTP